MAVKIELNYEGVGQLLKSQELADVLDSIAGEIATKCGDGYEHDLYVAPTRVIASVYPDTREAMQDCLENNTLLRGL